MLWFFLLTLGQVDISLEGTSELYLLKNIKKVNQHYCYITRSGEIHYYSEAGTLSNVLSVVKGAHGPSGMHFIEFAFREKDSLWLSSGNIALQVKDARVVQKKRVNHLLVGKSDDLYLFETIRTPGKYMLEVRKATPKGKLKRYLPVFEKSKLMKKNHSLNSGKPYMIMGDRVAYADPYTNELFLTTLSTNKTIRLDRPDLSPPLRAYDHAEHKSARSGNTPPNRFFRLPYDMIHLAFFFNYKGVDYMVFNWDMSAAGRFRVQIYKTSGELAAVQDLPGFIWDVDANNNLMMLLPRKTESSDQVLRLIPAQRFLGK